MTGDAPAATVYASAMSHFVSGNSIAEVAAMIGDAARVNILSALMGGLALTAGELASHAGVTPQTTSGHLARLLETGLIAVEKQGRHRYYRLASPDIAALLESLMTVASSGPKRHRPIGPRDEAMRAARSCYDHLAGRLGVALADGLHAQGHLHIGDGAALVTENGRQFLAGLGVTLPNGPAGKRPLCRLCLDWSERRPHLAGLLGAALQSRMFELDWIARIPGSRAIRVTQVGIGGLWQHFAIDADGLAGAAPDRSPPRCLPMR
jgi:DNA-binding transcriptional ArsR family regulator